MGRSIFDQFGLMVTLAFALPAMAAGVDLFLRGNRTWGSALLGIGILMVLMERYIDNPFNVGTSVAENLVDAAVKEPPEDDESTDSGRE